VGGLPGWPVSGRWVASEWVAPVCLWVAGPFSGQWGAVGVGGQWAKAGLPGGTWWCVASGQRFASPVGSLSGGKGASEGSGPALAIGPPPQGPVASGRPERGRVAPPLRVWPVGSGPSPKGVASGEWPLPA